jgi:tetratricopeptide (TPR) repeat protein
VDEEPDSFDLSDTDVLGGEPDDDDDGDDDFDDTDVLGGETDDDDDFDDTDVLVPLDPATTSDHNARITEEVTDRFGGKDEPDESFGSVELVPQEDNTSPTRTVPRHKRPSLGELEAEPEWESLDELERALSSPFGSDNAHSNQTLEIASVYSRSRIRRFARETGEGEAATDRLDPFEVTGFRTVFADGRDGRPDGEHLSSAGSGLREAPSTSRFEQPPSTGRSEALSEPRDWSQELLVGLEANDEQLRLERPWAQLVEELRQETVAETDTELRSSYLFLLANVLGLFGGVGREAADRLEEVGAQTAHPVRTLLVDLVVKHWKAPDERFIEALERLEGWDESQESDTAGVRRASIVVERLVAGGLDADIEQRLEQLLEPPQTLPGLTLRAIRAHQNGSRTHAAQIWRQVSRHLREDSRVVLVDTAAYFLRGTPGFFDYLQRRLESGSTSSTLLLMMQREAAEVGDHLREAVALRHLVAADVARGRSLRDADASRRARLKAIAAARFFRLSTLLEGLGRSRTSDSALSNLESHKVIRDAIALAPRRPLYLRRLARWSRARGDLNNCAKSLGTLAACCADRHLAALASAELARTIFIGGGHSEFVDQYLDEALEYDPDCAPARLSLAYRCIAADDEQGLAKLEASGSTEAASIDFAADERDLIRAGEWARLARLLEEKLESALDSTDWQGLTYRLAHLHGWYLSPGADARLRAEFLEQVLIANADHLAALVEILDVRLARREYMEAAEVLERLAELAVDPADQASWLTELAVLVEHYLGTPDWAFDCYEAALALQASLPASNSTSVDAFFGLLRTDVASTESAVDGIVDRLDAGVSVHEGAELALELILRVDETPQTADVLDERFPDEPLWQFVRMCLRVEAGQVDPAASTSLSRMWTHPSSEPLLSVFDRLFSERDGVSRQELSRRLNQIKSSPVAEGRLVRAMCDARELEDPEILGMLAALRSRRTSDVVSKATDLTFMAMTFLWRGQQEQALKVCEHILERFADFLPALKLAKILSERLARWAELVRWCEREAERTLVDQVAFEDRTAASEVQRKYLGDFDAACQQFRTVLDDDPSHREAFDKLKPLLLQRGEVGELHQLYERRIAQTAGVDEKCEMLNEMADIALHRGKDATAAISYFRRSLDLEPNQLRSLRILAELYHDDGQIDEALDCFREAAELSDNDTLLERLWLQIGRLLEEVERDVEALEAYEFALRINPTQADIILDVARLEAKLGDLQTALIHLQRLESTASNPEILREGRARKARYLVELDRDERQVLAAYRDLLLHHPEDSDAVDELRAYLDNHGKSEDAVEFFRALAQRSLKEMQGRPFEPHFDIARRLGDTDRAFLLAAVAKTLGYQTREMQQFYEEASGTRRWPTRAVPEHIIDELVPAALLKSFLKVLRLTEPAVRAALDPALAASAIEQATPLGDLEQMRGSQLRSRQASAFELALSWPSLHGVEIQDVLEVPEIDGGSLVFFGQRPSLVLGHRWRSESEPTELLVHLGKQLAAWALGVGAWQFLDTRNRFLTFSRIVSHLAPGWGGAAADRHIDGLDWTVVRNWLAHDGPDQKALGEHARELSGRLSSQAVEPQFRLVELAMERASCLLLDDPCRYMPHTKYLGSEHGLLQQPWSFAFSRIATEMRRHTGVALT